MSAAATAQVGGSGGVSLSHWTWNPALHFKGVRGVPADFDDQVKQRTLRFTLIERARALHSIEWELDNNDGLMFQPEYVALGVVVGVRLGYDGSLARWRFFILNKVRGEPGTVGSSVDTAVGGRGNVHKAGGTHALPRGARIIYYGRNRNSSTPKHVPRAGAAAGKGKSGGDFRRTRGLRKDKGASSSGKGKDFSATADILALDAMAWPLEGPKSYPSDTLTGAVKLIARAYGYFDEGRNVFVEDLGITLTAPLEIPDEVPEGVFLETLAQRHNCVFRIDEKTHSFYFHTPGWKGTKKGPAPRRYVVGGPDVLKVEVDVDFELPAPQAVKTGGINPVLRSVSTDEATASISEAYLSQFKLTPERLKNLTRNYAVPVSAAGQTASRKALTQFLERIRKAYRITLDVTGDPDLHASNRVILAGTGTPYVDDEWYAEEVKHQFSGAGGQTYVSTATLRIPTKSTPTRVQQIENHNTQGAASHSVGYVQGLPSNPASAAIAGAVQAASGSTAGAAPSAKPAPKTITADWASASASARAAQAKYRRGGVQP